MVEIDPNVALALVGLLFIWAGLCTWNDELMSGAINRAMALVMVVVGVAVFVLPFYCTLVMCGV